MSNPSSLLTLTDVVKDYPASPKPLRILDGVCFTLEPGECAAILGPSGCGKSTLLNLMGALDRPTAGSVRYRGVDTSTLDAAALAAFRNRDVGFVFQLHHLLPQCTVLENVLLPVLARGAGEEARQRALHLLDRVGLLDRRGHRPGELSGGERQRTAVARALINRPALLLADEPTGALNEEAAADLASLLLELRSDYNMSIVIVTHAREIARRFDRIFVLHGGRLEADGQP